jgi:hypothetical protein
LRAARMRSPPNWSVHTRRSMAGYGRPARSRQHSTDRCRPGRTRHKALPPALEPQSKQRVPSPRRRGAQTRPTCAWLKSLLLTRQKGGSPRRRLCELP